MAVARPDGLSSSGRHMVQQCRRFAAVVMSVCLLALPACTISTGDPDPEPSATSSDTGTPSQAPTESGAADLPLPDVRAVADLPDTTTEQLESVEVELEQISDLKNVTAMAVHP